jgi:hypothetical protein
MGRTQVTRAGWALSPVLVLTLAANGLGGAALADPAGSPGTASRTTSTTDRVGDPGRGTWRVVTQGSRSYRVTWTSTRRLPITDARPEIVRDEASLGDATLAANGRTVSVTVVGDRPPDSEELDVVLSGRRLDEPARPQPSGTTAPRRAAPPPPAPLLDVDPGLPGDLEITTSDYRLPGFKARRMPRLVEMVGHVVRPADGQVATDTPLVLFLHGRHSFCYDPTGSEGLTFRWPCRKGLKPVPSQLGYDYVQRLLASQGYTTVSVAANGINAQDDRAPDSGAGARARLVRLHLQQWASWAADGTYPVDMKNVVLVGHSRGGEGVNRASLETPLDAPYRITGQVLLAPTNFGRQTTAYVPTVTVLPYCDGDVVDLQGQSYTDLARDLTTDDTSLKSSVLVLGANHNFFNTEWTPRISAAPSTDDFGGRPDQVCGRRDPSRLTAREQRKVGKAYIAGAVHLMTGTDPATLPMFDGTRARVGSAGEADVRAQAIGGGRTLRRPGINTSPAPALGATTRVCAGRADTRARRACGRDISQTRTPHWVPGFLPGVPTSRAFEMAWDAPGERGGLVFTNPLDASTAASLDLRTIVDPSVGKVRVAVRLVDSAGQQVVVTPAARGLLRGLPRGGFALGKLLAQTLRVPLAGVSGIDLQHIVEVDLVGSSVDGHVWVLDIAAVQLGPLPVVPDRRLPTVSLGEVRRDEGDRIGPAVIEVPFTLSAPAPVPAQFVVTGQNLYDGRPIDEQRVVVDPGQVRGTIPLAYQGNRIDDQPVRGFLLSAYPVREVMTRNYVGLARVVDDDPRPRLSVRRSPARLAEGDALAWTVALSRRVGYDVFVSARPVAGAVSARPRLSVGDLPRRFRNRHGLRGVDLATPLNRSGLFLFGVLRAGRTSVRLRMPTRADAVTERTESVTLRVRAFPFGRREVPASFVRDAR